jgi:hypothetical protein
MLKGAMHVHSTYSDGEFTLPELRQIFLSEGCAFVCMTDHAEYFDQETIRTYIRECDSISDNKLRFIAGLEYECERRMHILGYGATTLANSVDPQEVIRHIDAQGAFSVIAHPKDEFFPWIEEFQSLPGAIETWNSKYDGRYAPRPGTFTLLKRLQERRPDLHAAYGQDLHWKKQFRGLFVQVETKIPDRDSVLKALSNGSYSGQKGELTLPSSGLLSQEVLSEFGRVHEKSHLMWRLLKNGKQTLDRLGIQVPDSIKAQLRRIF